MTATTKNNALKPKNDDDQKVMMKIKMKRNEQN